MRGAFNGGDFGVGWGKKGKNKKIKNLEGGEGRGKIQKFGV